MRSALRTEGDSASVGSFFAESQRRIRDYHTARLCPILQLMNLLTLCNSFHSPGRFFSGVQCFSGHITLSLRKLLSHKWPRTRPFHGGNTGSNPR